MTDPVVAQKIAAFGSLIIFWLLESWLPYAQNRKQRYQHAAKNLLLGFGNSFLTAILFGAAIVRLCDWTAANQIGLLHQLVLPQWAGYGLAILGLDAWMYLWHRLNHQVSFLWRFHRVHHCDAEMDVTSATRFHTIEILISVLLKLALIPLLGFSLLQIVLYEAILLPAIYFQHSNINLPAQFDRILRVIFTTPALHRIHHSRVRSEHDSNYGSVFSWWDRFAQTFYLRGDETPVTLGLNGFDEAKQQSLMGLLQMPFTRAVSATTHSSSPLSAPANPARRH